MKILKFIWIVLLESRGFRRLYIELKGVTFRLKYVNMYQVSYGSGVSGWASSAQANLSKKNVM